MAELIYASAALADLDRVLDFLLDAERASAVDTIDLIVEAVDILARHPLMGRPAEEGLRELVISRGRSGYVALYSHETGDDTVLILAVRHQREAGYTDDRAP